MTVEELQILVSAKTENAQAKINKLKGTLEDLEPNQTPNVSVNTGEAQTSLKKLQEGINQVLVKVQDLQGSLSAPLPMPSDAGISKQYEELQATLGNLNGGISKSQTYFENISNAVQPLKDQLVDIASKVNNFTGDLAPLNNQLAEITAKMDNFGASAGRSSSGTKAIGNWSQRSARELKKLQAEIDRTQAKINKLEAEQNTVQSQIGSRASMYSAVPNLSGMGHEETVGTLMDNDPTIQKLTAQANALDAQIAPLNAHLEETRAKITALGSVESTSSQGTEELGLQTKQAGNSLKQASSHANEFSRRLNMMLVRIAVLRVISTVFQSIGEGFQNIAKGNDSANETLSQLSTSALYLKNSIAASLMPAVQAVTPFITQMVDALAGVFNNLSMLTARIFSQTSAVTIAKRASVDYAKTLNGVSTSADKAKGSLASFDQINTLSKASTTSSDTTGMPAASDMFETVQIPEKVGDMVDKIKASLADITAAASGALLAIGTILVLTGANVPLGLGLMAIGAIGLAADIAANWGSMDASLQNTLTTITTAVGGFLLTLGAILTFTGTNVPLGIGLMIAGAGSLAAAVAINWGSNQGDVSTAMSAITGVVSGAALALGALFALTGVDVPLGIGLMLVGAVGIASAVALNWGGMSDSTRETVSTITGIVGGALLALGAILTFTGAAPALGIPMMIVGASTLATTIALNWNSMGDQLRTTLTLVTAILGTFLLVLGAILTFSGTNVPLGIALMIAGAGSLAASAVLNWDAIKDTLVSVLAAILALVSTALVAVGIILCLSGVGIPLGIGLIITGMAGMIAAPSISSNPITEWARDLVNGIIDIFETGINWVISMIDKVQFTVPDWVWGIGGQTYGVNISQIHIPRLATGGVVKGATPLLAGEDGAEAIVPLENNTEWASQVAALLRQQGGAEGTGDINITLPIYLDRNGTLLDTIIERYTRQTRAEG